MLGGNLKKSKLVKIGNPFFRNHFFKTHEDPNYYHIWIDWQQAVREGRLTLEYVEEQRSSMTPEDFGVMYAVLFPDALSDDALFNFEIIDKAKIIKDFKITEWKVAGLDLSRGGKDATVLTFFEIDDHNLRVHKQVAKIDTSDSIQVANWVIDLHKEMKFEALGYDALGLGGPVGDYLYNLPDLGFDIVEYKAGTKAIDPAFANIKSQLLFALRTWCERGQADLSACHGQMFVDLLGCKKKRLSDRAMKVEDPTDSPDYMDSLLAGLFVVWGSNIPNITVQQ